MHGLDRTKGVWAALVVVALILQSAAMGLATELPPGGSFVDDDGSVHEADIEAIAAQGITKGCNPPVNDRFCPDAPVTRGQMAAFLVRALGYTDDGGDLFVDDNSSVFEDDIDKLGTAGITKGCNPPVDDRFCPDVPVTRGQMAAFLVRALGYTDDGGDLFVDDNSSVFEDDIDKLGTAGITKGCNPPANDRYCPDSPVTRAQMATFLTRALDLVPVEPPGTFDADELVGRRRVDIIDDGWESRGGAVISTDFEWATAVYAKDETVVATVVHLPTDLITAAVEIGPVNPDQLVGFGGECVENPGGIPTPRDQRTVAVFTHIGSFSPADRAWVADEVESSFTRVDATLIQCWDGNVH